MCNLLTAAISCSYSEFILEQILLDVFESSFLKDLHVDRTLVSYRMCSIQFFHRAIESFQQMCKKSTVLLNAFGEV